MSSTTELALRIVDVVDEKGQSTMMPDSSLPSTKNVDIAPWDEPVRRVACFRGVYHVSWPCQPVMTFPPHLRLVLIDADICLSSSLRRLQSGPSDFRTNPRFLLSGKGASEAYRLASVVLPNPKACSAYQTAPALAPACSTPPFTTRRLSFASPSHQFSGISFVRSDPGALYAQAQTKPNIHHFSPPPSPVPSPTSLPSALLPLRPHLNTV